MNNQEAKKILQRDLEILIENKSLPDGIEAMKVAISALGAIEQFRWERDVAISQLEELGLSLGQKVDHVKEAIDKATPMKLKEVKGMYDITKPVCPRCGDDLFGEYCSECGQKLTQE